MFDYVVDFLNKKFIILGFRKEIIVMLVDEVRYVFVNEFFY